MSHPTSLVPVSVADIRRAVEAMTAAVPCIIAKEREKTILNVLDEHRRWAWWPLRRRLTRAEAEQVVDTAGIGEMGFPSEYSWWRSRASELETFIRHLTRAADLSRGEAIWLNLDDADTVAGWLKP